MLDYFMLKGSHGLTKVKLQEALNLKDGEILAFEKVPLGTHPWYVFGVSRSVSRNLSKESDVLGPYQTFVKKSSEYSATGFPKGQRGLVEEAQSILQKKGEYLDRAESYLGFKL